MKEAIREGMLGRSVVGLSSWIAEDEKKEGERGQPAIAS